MKNTNNFARRITALLASLVLVLTITQPSQAQRWTPTSPEMNSIGVNISESVPESTGGTSQFLMMDPLPPGVSGMPNQTLCNDFGQECLPTTGRIPYAKLVLPPCESGDFENCIESLYFIDTASGSKTKATLIRTISGPTVAANEELGVPFGGTTSLWQAEGFTHEGNADTYAITANLELGTNGKTFTLSNLNAVVNPYTQISGNYKTIEYAVSTQNGVTFAGSSGVDLSCAWNEAGLCGSLQDFGSNVKLELSLRVSTQISGWFKGRLSKASISTKELSKTQRRLIFSGEPIQVPVFAFSKPKSEATPAELAYMEAAAGWIGGWMGSRSDEPRSVKALDTFRESAKDTATALLSTWSVGAIAPSGNVCLSDRTKVHGLVTTNSMLYQPNAPSFKSGTLSYQVSGTHYLPDGKTLSLGSYELIMNSTTARCLYGFSNAPISASVTISGSDQVATTVVSEKSGWLKLSANGFTFSNKTIKVKLNQKKKTITCVTKKKPTKTKKVTAYSPKCPTGYKKK